MPLPPRVPSFLLRCYSVYCGIEEPKMPMSSRLQHLKQRQDRPATLQQQWLKIIQDSHHRLSLSLSSPGARHVDEGSPARSILTPDQRARERERACCQSRPDYSFVHVVGCCDLCWVLPSSILGQHLRTLKLRQPLQT